MVGYRARAGIVVDLETGVLDVFGADPWRLEDQITRRRSGKLRREMMGCRGGGEAREDEERRLTHS